MSTVRLAAVADLVTACRATDERPFFSLDLIESGTGRLLSDLPILSRTPPEAGAAAVSAGDVLFGKLRPYLSKSLLVDCPAYASTELLCMRPVLGTEPRWLAYVAQSRPFVEWAMATSDGTKMPRTSWERLRDFRVSRPTPRRQRAIATFLDAETTRIDVLIAKKRRLVTVVDERIDMELTELACGRMLERPLIETGIEWLQSIPAHWQVQRLKYVARLESGHTPSRTRPELWENCATPWVTLNDVGYLESHEFVEETVNMISEEGLAASSARILPTGTVVLSRDATVGRCGILARPMATSQHFVDWICSETMRPRFLWLLFKSAMQAHFESLTAGATLRTIGMPDVKRFEVPVPPLADQDRIIEEADSARRSARRTTDAISRQIDLLTEHRQSLITAAVTGALPIPGATP